MKKRTMILSMFFSIMFCTTVFAQDLIYTVKPGDTLWKIAVANETGVNELIAKNPQLSNPNLIYPGNKINVPNINDIKSSETEVVRLVNRERTSRGLKPLSNNWELERIARYKSQDMVNKNYFSHTSPTYGSPFTMMQNFGVKFSAAGENIAMGQKTPAEVVNSWMNSPGHRANILGTSYTQIGVGLAKNNNGVCYWTQMFIRP